METVHLRELICKRSHAWTKGQWYVQRREASDRATRVEWLLDWNKNTGIDIQQRNKNKLFALDQVAAALAVNMLSVRPNPQTKKKKICQTKTYTFFVSELGYKNFGSNFN
jgi:hypothetical protein